MVHCLQYRQLTALHGALLTPPGPTVCRLGYAAKQGYVICRICVCRNGHKCSVPKGAAYPQACPSWCQIAKVDTTPAVCCQGMRWTPLWGSDRGESLTPRGSPNQCTGTSAGSGRATSSPTLGSHCAAWRGRSALQLHPYG